MATQHVETLIIGAGQAGLAVGYHLQRQGRPFLIVDAGQRIGDNWRVHWDSLRLFTPAKYDALPGLAFPADRWHFPGKDEVADYLEQYALHFDLPVRLNTRVDALRRRPEGGYAATVGDSTVTADNIVIATGTFGRTPSVPDFADQLDPSVHQLHSSEYKRPSELPDGKVLVVGASHSGCDIAYEIAETRPTVLCGRDCGQFPVNIESRPARIGFPLMVFVWRHLATRRTPLGRKAMGHVRSHGGPMLRVRRGDLAARGIERIEQRVTGVVDGRPALADGTVLDVDAVVWCTGFHQDLGWVDSLATDDGGWPDEYRGVAESAPGLFFCGLSFQFAFASMVLPGVGRDAKFIADQIVKRLDRAEPELAPAA